MTFARIRNLHYAAPFRPFEIISNDGRQIRVNHPEFKALSPDEDKVVVYESNGHLTIDMPMVVAVMELKNGASLPKRKQ